MQRLFRGGQKRVVTEAVVAYNLDISPSPMKNQVNNSKVMRAICYSCV